MAYRENNIYYQPLHFSFHDCDIPARVRMSSLLGYMSDIAGDDYREMGYSHEYLWENGMVFLVSRTTISFNRDLKKNEDVLLATYERGAKGPIFTRNYEFIDKDGQVAVGSKAAWILCDPHSHKILKPSSLGRPIETWEDRLPWCPEAKRLKVPQTAKHIYSHPVRYSDIDSNGHLFNAFYADIASNALPAELIQREFKEFSINFSREAMLGDTLEVYAEYDENSAHVYGKNADEVSFICEFLFR